MGNTRTLRLDLIKKGSVILVNNKGWTPFMVILVRIVLGVK